MNVIVHDELLWEIHQWRREGAENEDVIARLRPKTVPQGFTPQNWIPGRFYTFVFIKNK